MFKLFASLLIVFLFSCQKGDKIHQESYMRLTLAAYHPDTSVFAQVKVNDAVLTNSQQFHGDEPFNIFLQQGTTVFSNSGLLDVLLVKSSGKSMVFKDTVNFKNINSLFLFQTCPDSEPMLMDLTASESTEPPPVADSVKVRFFFSSNEMIVNPNSGYVGRPVKRMRIQVFTFTPDLNPNNPPSSSSFVLINNAVDFNECGLSEYITLARNKKYGFRVRDISAGIPSSAAANLVQQLLPANDIQLVYDQATGFPDWDFKQGKISSQVSPESDHFQTLRIRRSVINYLDRDGNDAMDTSYNSTFVFGQK